MRKNSRTKGHSFERSVCKLLNDKLKIETTKYKWKRVPLSGGFDKQNFPGDIYTTGITRFSEMFSIECKFYKTWKLEDLINGNSPRILEWWKQASDDAAGAEKYPLLIFKKNNSKIYFMIREKDLKEYTDSNDKKYIAGNILCLPSKYNIIDKKTIVIGLFDNLLKCIKHIG